MQDKPPNAPDPAQTYEQGINIYLRHLPELLAAEQNARTQYDPARIQEQQALQAIYGPTQYGQQLQALQQLDPQGYATRALLGNRVQQDLAQGYNLPEQYSNELTNQFRGAEAARGNSLGTGNASAEAAFKGQAALNLYQQHLQNAGNFLSSPTPEQQIGFIQGVSPDRSSAYTNPNAGYQGVNIGQQNYQNLLAQYQLSGAGRNPWAGALGGAATGAATGAGLGGWGALAGGLIGGIGGYFSDLRVKENIEEVGRTRDGHRIVRFNYKGLPEKTFEGVIAQEIQKTCPKAVFEWEGLLGVDYDLIDVDFKEVTA